MPTAGRSRNGRDEHGSVITVVPAAAGLLGDLLEAVEAQIKIEFSTGIVALVDAVGDEADDAVAMWKVRAAREAAWTHAEVLWALRATPALRDAFFSRLDSFTGFAGRGLLLPAARLKDRK